MVDVRELLESAEMNDVVRAIEALRRRYAPTAEYKNDHEWPVAIARVGRFRAELVFKIILSDEKYYPGYKEVLTAALAGWVISPPSVHARESLMIHAAVAFMEKAGELVGNQDLLTLQKDLAARYVIIGPQFLTEIYDCLGGSQAFADAPSFDELWNAFDSIEKQMITVARAIAYLHHAVDKFSRPGIQLYPSLNKAVAILNELKKRVGKDKFQQKYVSRSTLHYRWSNTKETLALIYAASTIKVNRKTLLGLILDGFLSYDDHRAHIHLWAGRAKYVSEHIFARMDDLTIQRKTDRLLGKVSPVKFKPPKLDPIEVACFDHTFRRFIRY
ncbi:hypothetical protein [Shinella oryzae]|uniref:Uncharacterized protein n=1 Tax=Shinella oryzae TaxID=2871820 RepID=A0ABY9K6F6_9HYPH|nr:hypothetical protein [Shinella oryzae]WLS04150.1 hypothetical protein Q9315_05900 [Shinella oryzae]